MMQNTKPFEKVLRLLKEEAERRVGLADAIYTVSFPAWLDNNQRQQISMSLKLAGIHDSACHGDATSPSVAVWAHRQSQMHQASDQADIHCTHGWFGKETAISLEHNEHVVAIQKQVVWVGDDTAHVTESGGTKVFLKPEKDEDAPSFWRKVMEHIQLLLSPNPPDVFHPDKFFRLALSGSLAHDRHLLEAVAAAADELLPTPESGFEPLGINNLLS